MIVELTREEQELVRNYRDAKPLHRDMAREILECSIIEKQKDAQHTKCKVLMFNNKSATR